MRIHKRVRRLVAYEISRVEENQDSSPSRGGLLDSPSADEEEEATGDILNTHSVLEMLSENRELKETVRIL